MLAEAKQLAPVQQTLRQVVPRATCTLSTDCKMVRCGACDNLFVRVRLDFRGLSFADIQMQADQLANKIADAEIARLARTPRSPGDRARDRNAGLLECSLTSGSYISGPVLSSTADCRL
jgi:hypothetical protein